MWNSSFNVEEGLLFLTCLYVEYAFSVLLKTSLRTELTNLERLIVFIIQPLKPQRRFVLLPYSAAKPIKITVPESLSKDVLKLVAKEQAPRAKNQKR